MTEHSNSQLDGRRLKIEKLGRKACLKVWPNNIGHSLAVKSDCFCRSMNEKGRNSRGSKI